MFTGLACPTNRVPDWREECTHQRIDAGAARFVAHGHPALHGFEYRFGKSDSRRPGQLHFPCGADNGPLRAAGRIQCVRLLRVCGKKAKILALPVIGLALDTSSKVPRRIPYRPLAEEAEAVLRRLAHLAKKHGTQIEIEGEEAPLVLP